MVTAFVVGLVVGAGLMYYMVRMGYVKIHRDD